MIATGIFWAVKIFAFGKSPIGRWVFGAFAVGVVAWFVYSKIEQRGFDRCKGDWDASIFETRKRVNDAVDRARDGRVPDPFDGDR
jgi:hypothetical protein